MMIDVLLVDDDRDVLEAISARLTLAGLRVKTCGAYIEAIDYLAPHFPGCVVTDIRMPGKSGFDLISKAHAIDPELPVIAITGFAQTATVVKAMREGAVTVLEKPCEMVTLLDAITDAGRKREAVMKARQNRSQRATRHSTGRPPAERTLSPQLGAYECELIRRALKRNKGDKLKTVSELGISKSQLYAKLKSFGLT
ncbi:MAG: two-component system C4-dicarboxylate transport response regulator DctD [Ascidiaceihabitans sp.]|jgi:two-component system C4-dicarboxylate transport response regulator DctD